jgi:predicted nucleic acid-binding protein
MIVADANLLIYLLGAEPETERAREVFRRDPQWAAPLLWRSEFRNVMALGVRRGALSVTDAVARVRRAQNVLARREFDVISERVLTLAAGSGCTAYDCEYVDLAQRLDAPLVTSDRKLLAAVPLVAISPQGFLDS